jgi:hypothetical protein
VRGYSKENYVIVQEETPSGNPVASESGVDGLFKAPETSIVAADPKKNKSFGVTSSGSKYTMKDLHRGQRGMRGGL